MSLHSLKLARRAVLGGALALGLLAAAPAGAAGLGPLEPYLLLGSDPPWTGAMEGGTYRLTNAAPNTDIIYFVAALPGGAAQEVSVSIGIAAQPGAGYSGAGILFNFDAASRTYLAVVATATDELAIYQRNEQGVSELARLPLGVAAAGGVLRLALRATGRGVAFEVNGTNQGSIDGIGLTGQAGILAIDGGSYSFADYQVR
jgi:hypothetical protein